MRDEDRAEAEALRNEGRDAPSEDELRLFDRWRRVDPGFEVGPLAPTAIVRFAAHAPGLLARFEGTAEELASAALVSEPATALRLTLRTEAALRTAASIRIVRRAPSPEGSKRAAELTAIDPILAGALFIGTFVSLPESEELLLEPLPPEPAVAVALVAPTGLTGPWHEIALRIGETVEATLIAADDFPPGSWSGRTLEGRVSWERGGPPIARAIVYESTSERFAVSDAEGRFTFRRVPTGRELRLRFTSFDPAAAQRCEERTLVLGDEALLEFELPRLRRIEARHLEIPSGAPAAKPLAFALESMGADGTWRGVAAETYEPRPGGVDVGVGALDGVFRVGAVWSSVYVVYTAPAVMGAGATAVAADFLPPPAVPLLLEGTIVDAAGQAISGALVEAFGPIGGVPPASARTSESGRFFLGPVNVEDVALRCRGVETALRPGTSSLPLTFVVSAK